MDRKPSVNLAPSSSADPLPKARKHVQVRMTEVMMTFFAGTLGEREVAAYANELEAALWGSFKDMVNGKEATGGRYK